jgi:hypothetical protein
MKPSQIIKIWQHIHGPLNEDLRARFLARPELKNLSKIQNADIISKAIERHPRIVDFVPAALALEARSSKERSLAINKRQVNKRVQNVNSNLARKPSPAKKSKKRSNHTQTVNIQPVDLYFPSYLYPKAPRKMLAEWDDREACSSCGALISASMASLHKCP